MQCVMKSTPNIFEASCVHAPSLVGTWFRNHTIKLAIDATLVRPHMSRQSRTKQDRAGQCHIKFWNPKVCTSSKDYHFLDFLQMSIWITICAHRPYMIDKTPAWYQSAHWQDEIITFTVLLITMVQVISSAAAVMQIKSVALWIGRSCAWDAPADGTLL